MVDMDTPRGSTHRRIAAAMGATVDMVMEAGTAAGGITLAVVGLGGVDWEAAVAAAGEFSDPATSG